MSRESAENDYMLGMKYKDIAKKYSVSIDTVKSWKKRYKWNRKECTQEIKKGAHKKSNDEHTKETIDSIVNNQGLNDKQRLFCLYYAKSFNATRSYQKAYECDYETALSIGYRLLEKDGVRKEIMKLKRSRYSRALLEPEDIFQKYIDIAYSDITHYVSFGQKDVTTIEDGESIVKKVNTVDFKESTEVDGSLISEISQGKEGIRIKLLDKMKAMEWLGSHMDMATEEQRARIENLKNNQQILQERLTMEKAKFLYEIEKDQGEVKVNSLADAVKKIEERRNESE